jgi:hypothetical protein
MINVRKYLSNVPNYDAEDVLDLIGLQKKSSADWVFPMLAGVGAGMAIGAGLAFFLTPYKGSEFREKVVKGATEAKGYLETQAGKISEKVMGSDTTGTSAVTATRPVSTGTSSIGTGSSMGSGNGNRSY